MMRLGRSDLSAVRPRAGHPATLASRGPRCGDPGSRFRIACLALGSRLRGNERMSEPAEAIQTDLTRSSLCGAGAGEPDVALTRPRGTAGGVRLLAKPDPCS